MQLLDLKTKDLWSDKFTELKSKLEELEVQKCMHIELHKWTALKEIPRVEALIFSAWNSFQNATVRKHIRELAVRRILGARDEKTKNSGGLRFLKLPKLNFEATDYIDLIDWSNCVVTEPPLTMHIKDKDLKEM
ncbi:hypothetical protein AVEN_224270-1 [Araneus ventricosus]|uniref:Uncharacterized protein n=1 Tax=Araneus ventricosus TaxID=182803 RepID=A0A4Y2S7B8_ARAVE|nr:hypothetical protein AVEN_224270-1 [Araneus ventricosus]